MEAFRGRSDEILKPIRNDLAPQSPDPNSIPTIGISSPHRQPDRKLITTSHVERSNLSIRMEMKRFARLTLCFSKSVKHLRAAINVWMAYYNLCRTHRGIGGRTPAMALGLTSEPWPLERLTPA